MSFPTNPALEKAVITDAQNDLPRLVYADWLDENGDPARADFIRVQCALYDKNPADPDYPDLIELRREAFDRLKGRRDLEPKLPAGVDFYGSLYDPDRDDTGLSFHRGFPYFATHPYLGNGWSPEKEEAAADRFAAALPNLLAETTLRGLKLGEHLSRHLHRILPAEACGQFTALSADNPPYQRASGRVEALLCSPMRASLRWLDLDVSGDVEVNALAAAKFPKLRRWDAHLGVGGSPAALKKLLASDWFGGLERVLMPLPKAKAAAFGSALAECPRLHTLHAWEVPTGSMSALRRPGGFRSLGRLEVRGDLSLASAKTLAKADFPKLAVLELNAAMRNDDLKALMTADWFAGLRVLELDCDNLGDQGVVALGQSAAATNLRSLSVHTSKLRPKGFASLARDFPKLTTLAVKAVHTVKATPTEMAAFTGALGLPNLRHLTLTGSPLGDEGAIALANNPALANLTRLDVSYSEIGAKGVRSLLASPQLQRLVFLSLNGSPGGAGMDTLTDPAVMPHLAHCWLPDRVTKAVFAKLTNDRGDIFVGGPR